MLLGFTKTFQCDVCGVIRSYPRLPKTWHWYKREAGGEVRHACDECSEKIKDAPQPDQADFEVKSEDWN